MDKTVFIQAQSGLNFDWNSISVNPGAHHEPQMDVVAYKALYINKIAQARAKGLEPVLVSLPIMDDSRYFAYITRGMSTQERMNVLYWLGGHTERLRNIQSLYNLALFRIAATQCVHIIDITSPMLADSNYDHLLQYDGVSLSDDGASLVNGQLLKIEQHEAAA
jgi:hypothetical protein